MDIRRTVSDFIVQGGELLSRLRSYEGEMLKEADLHLLRVELQQARSSAVNPPPTNSVPERRKSAVESRPAAVASDMTLDWNGELRRLIEEEQNGLRKSGREEIHESRSDDGA